VITFALEELNISDLEKVYDMTMAEFKLREYGYVRAQQWDWAKYRLVGYMAIRSFNVNPKDIPKRLDAVMKLNFVDKGIDTNVTDKQKEAIKEAQKVFMEQQKIKQIGRQ